MTRSRPAIIIACALWLGVLPAWATPVQPGDRATNAIGAADADADERAWLQQHVLALEFQLQQERLANDALERSLDQLGMRVREAEERDREDAMFQALLGVIVLLVGAVGILLRQLARLKRRQPGRAASPAPAQPGRVAVTEPFGVHTEPLPMRLTAPPAPLPRASASVTATRPGLWVEELHDLEQRADFFVAPGQGKAAGEPTRGPSGVDVLLPLDGVEEPRVVAPAQQPQRPQRTQPAKRQRPTRIAELDLDLDVPAR